VIQRLPARAPCRASLLVSRHEGEHTVREGRLPGISTGPVCSPTASRGRGNRATLAARSQSHLGSLPRLHPPRAACCSSGCCSHLPALQALQVCHCPFPYAWPSVRLVTSCRQRKQERREYLLRLVHKSGTIRRAQIHVPSANKQFQCLAMMLRARALIISFVVACVEGAAASPWIMCAREPSGPGSSAAFIKLFSPQQSLWRARRARDRRVPCPTSAGPWCLAGQG
jgi:hypothetical protein